MQTPNHDVPTDLLKRAQNGCAEAFAQFYQQLMPVVRRFVQRRGSWLEANATDDVVQEVFLQAWKSRANFRAESTAQTWLLGIASNLLHKQRLRFGRPATESLDRYAEVTGAWPASRISPGSTDGQFEFPGELVTALGRLSTAQRQAFVLVHIDQIEISQAARMVNCSVPAFYDRLYTARQRLRESLRVALK